MNAPRFPKASLLLLSLIAIAPCGSPHTASPAASAPASPTSTPSVLPSATATAAAAPPASPSATTAGKGACTVYTEPHNNISVCYPSSWYVQAQGNPAGFPPEQDFSLQQRMIPANFDTVALRFITDQTTEQACLTSSPGGPPMGSTPDNVGPAVGVIYSTEPPAAASRVYGFGSNQWLGGRCARLWFMFGSSELRDSYRSLALTVIDSVTFS